MLTRIQQNDILPDVNVGVSLTWPLRTYCLLLAYSPQAVRRLKTRINLVEKIVMNERRVI